MKILVQNPRKHNTDWLNRTTYVRIFSIITKIHFPMWKKSWYSFNTWVVWEFWPQEALVKYQSQSEVINLNHFTLGQVSQLTKWESSIKSLLVVCLICGGASDPIRISVKCFNHFKYLDKIAKQLLKSKYRKFILPAFSLCKTFNCVAKAYKIIRV